MQTSDDNSRNSRNIEEDVVPFNDLWVCPACREVNSEEKQKCVACGQRVVYSIASTAAEADATAADDEPQRAAEPLEEIRSLAPSIYDWVCPMCGATVHSYTRPNAKLQLTAKLLLAGSLPVTGIWCAALFVIGFRFKLGEVLAWHRLQALLMFVPGAALSWWALSLPRVVSLRCTKCGARHRQYRAAPGFLKIARR